MPEGFLGSTETSPGKYQEKDRVQDWSGQIQNPTYIPTYDKFVNGPDAQGNITHRNWDPYNRLTPSTAINLCANNYYQSVEEIYDGEGTPFDANMVRSYVRRFRVKTKYTTMGPAAACACPGIPMPYAPYIPGRPFEWDMYARAVRISARRERATENEFSSWIVQVDYSTQMPDGGPIPPSEIGLGFSGLGAQNKPWDEPPALEWDPETTTTTPLADKDGNPFVNSAGQPIYPAPPVEQGVAVLTIKRNWRFNSLYQSRLHVEKFSHVVNANAFVGASRGQVLSLPPKAVERYRGPLRYWEMTYRLKFKKGPQNWKGWLEHLFTHDTWQPKLLDAGMYEIKHVAGVPDPNRRLVPIFRAGVQVTQPVPLKNGRMANPTDPISAQNWLRFRYYAEEDFTDLIPTGKL